MGGQRIQVNAGNDKKHSSAFPSPLPLETRSGAVGTLPGKFTVSDTGSPNYEVPLDVPPGRNGIQPSLAIAYVGGSANGIMGLRWALTGLSKIERCAKTVAVDGYAAQVQLTSQDAYCIDGQRMVADAGAAGTPWHEYHTEIESFQLIRSGGIKSGESGEYVGPAYFIVFAKDGRQLIYGSRGDRDQSMDNVLTTRGVRRVWYLTEVRDRSGAFMTYFYKQTKSGNTTTEIYPLEIAYGGQTSQDIEASTVLSPHDRSVRFLYEERPDPRHHYVLGEQTHSTTRLRGIQSRAEGHSVKYFELRYEKEPTVLASTYNESRLVDMRVCGFTADGAGGRCLPATKLQYNAPIAKSLYQDYGANHDYFPDPYKNYSAWYAREENVMAVGDFNGDGRDDLIVRETTSTSSRPKAFKLLLSEGSRVQPPTGSPFQTRIVTDTFKDVVDPSSAEFEALIGTDDPFPGNQTRPPCTIDNERWCRRFASGSEPHPGCDQCDFNMDPSLCTTIHWNTCPYPDKFIKNDADYSKYVDDGMRTKIASSLQEDNSSFTGVLGFWPSYLTVDVDGDGRDDIVTHQSMGDPSKIRYGTSQDPSFAGLENKTLTEINPRLKAPETINMFVFRSTGTGFEKVAYPTKCFSNTAMLADVDSDGRRDVVCCDKRGFHINRLNGAGGFYPEEWVDMPNAGYCSDMAPVDTDGDGSEEALVFASGGVQAKILVRASTGTYSWKNAGLQINTDPSPTPGGEINPSADCGGISDPTCRFKIESFPTYYQGSDTTGVMAQLLKLDVNGDGLKDLYYRGGLWLNRGNGFTASSYTMPPVRWHYFDQDIDKLIVFDYDNDGRDDLINWHSGDMLRGTARGEMEYVKLAEPGCGNQSAYANERQPSYSGVILADLNGDGNRDWVCSGLNTERKYQVGIGVLWTQNTEVGLLANVEDGVGKRFDIRYRVDGEGASGALVYEHQLPISPISDVVRRRRVAPLVSRYAESQRFYDSGGALRALQQNATHRFRYYAANTGLNGRGWYGFESKEEAIESPTGEFYQHVQTLFNNQEFWNAGTVAEVRRTHAGVAAGIGHGAFNRREQTVVDWRQYSTPWSRGSRFVAPQSVVTATIEGVLTLTQSQVTFEYDDFGNVSKKATTNQTYGQSQEDWSIESATYLPILNRWVVTNPGQTQLTAVFGLDQRERTLSYSYYSNGLLDSAIREPDKDAYRQTLKLIRDDTYFNVIETRIADATGSTRSATTEYDSRGRFPIRQRNAKGHATEVQFDARNGQLLTSMDPNGVVTQIQYDTLGRRTLEQLPTETVTQEYKQAWSAVGAPYGAMTITTNVRGGPEVKSEEVTVDANGAMLTRTTTGLGGSTLREDIVRDWTGRVTAATAPHVDGDRTQGQRYFYYDAMGRLISETTPDQRVIEYGYPTATIVDEPYAALFAENTQNAITSTVTIQPNGRGEIILSDRRGLPVAVGQWNEGASTGGAADLVSGKSPLTSYRYNAFGQITEVKDPDGETSWIGYDAIGRRTVALNASTGTRTYQYNGFDEVNRYTDGENHLTCHYYDVLGRPMLQIEGDSSGNCSLSGATIASFTFDGDGSRDNELGHVVSAWRRAGPGSAEGTTLTYRYEARPASGPNTARLKSVEQQVPGLDTGLVTAIDYWGPWVSQVNYPSADGASFGVRYGYDGTGLVTQVSDAASLKSFWSATEFDLGKRIKREVFGNDVETAYEYNGVVSSASGIQCSFGTSPESCVPGSVHGMVTKRHGVSDGNSHRSLTYGYDKMGQVNDVTKLFGSGERDRMLYAHDYLGRLTRESHWKTDSQIEATRWQYSNGGDIIRISNDLNGATLQEYSYANSSRKHLVTSTSEQTFEYNLNGSQVKRGGTVAMTAVQAFEYNDFEMPWRITSSSGGDTRIEYDPNHQRVAKRATAKTTIYAGQLYECDGTTPTIGGTFDCANHRHSIYANGRLVAVVTTDEVGSSSTEYVHGDHLGSSTLTTGETGAVVRERKFSAFGSTTSTIGDSAMHWGFTGHEHDDDLGLINMRGRLYDPKLSRFISADPYVTSPLNTQGLNRYSYVRNSPLNSTDPTGFQAYDQSASPPSGASGGGSIPGNAFATYACPGGGPGGVAATIEDDGNWGMKAFGGCGGVASSPAQSTPPPATPPPAPVAPPPSSTTKSEGTGSSGASTSGGSAGGNSNGTNGPLGTPSFGGHGGPGGNVGGNGTLGNGPSYGSSGTLNGSAGNGAPGGGSSPPSSPSMGGGSSAQGGGHGGTNLGAAVAVAAAGTIFVASVTYGILSGAATGGVTTAIGAVMGLLGGAYGAWAMGGGAGAVVAGGVIGAVTGVLTGGLSAGFSGGFGASAAGPVANVVGGVLSNFVGAVTGAALSAGVTGSAPTNQDVVSGGVSSLVGGVLGPFYAPVLGSTGADVVSNASGTAAGTWAAAQSRQK